MNNNFIMTNGTIRGMEAFADTVKVAMELCCGDGVKVVVHDVRKNNDVVYKGITIVQSDCNLSPTINLEPYYAEYRAGRTMASICDEIMEVYEKHSVHHDFDITMLTDFNRVRNNVCFKLVNAGRNRDLLADVPYKMVEDLAVVFYIDVYSDRVGKGTVTVQNHLMNMWSGVDTDTLYELALANTQRKYHGRICSMASLMTEVLDEVYATEFFDLSFADDVPMFFASNVSKIYGAGVVLYEGLLKAFAECIGGDFFILPSSIHDVLFVPAFIGIDVDSLKEMVQSVNATEVSEQEFLSNNVYFYSLADDRMVIA